PAGADRNLAEIFRRAGRRNGNFCRAEETLKMSEPIKVCGACRQVATRGVVFPHGPYRVIADCELRLIEDAAETLHLPEAHAAVRAQRDDRMVHTGIEVGKPQIAEQIK